MIPGRGQSTIRELYPPVSDIFLKTILPSLPYFYPLGLLTLLPLLSRLPVITITHSTKTSLTRVQRLDLEQSRILKARFRASLLNLHFLVEHVCTCFRNLLSSSHSAPNLPLITQSPFFVIIVRIPWLDLREMVIVSGAQKNTQSVLVVFVPSSRHLKSGSSSPPVSVSAGSRCQCPPVV